MKKNNQPTRIFMKRHGFKVAISAECTCFFIFFVGAEPDVPCPHTGTSPAASGSKPGSCTSSLYLQSGGRFFSWRWRSCFFPSFFRATFSEWIKDHGYVSVMELIWSGKCLVSKISSYYGQQNERKYLEILWERIESITHLFGIWRDTNLIIL